MRREPWRESETSANPPLTSPCVAGQGRMRKCLEGEKARESEGKMKMKKLGDEKRESEREIETEY